jgi:hypothetical protein
LDQFGIGGIWQFIVGDKTILGIMAGSFAIIGMMGTWVRAGPRGGRYCQTVCKPGSVPSEAEALKGDGHSSGTPVAERLARPTRAAARKPACGPKPGMPPLFGLAPGGVCPATTVTGGAVRSYRTLSPLPVVTPKGSSGGLLSVALSLGSPPPGVTRHRVPVEPGLSSLRRFPICER